MFNDMNIQKATTFQLYLAYETNVIINAYKKNIFY